VVRIFLIMILPMLLLSTENNTTDSSFGLLPNLGWLAQRSLGPTVIVGLTYGNHNMELSNVTGLYGSIEVGQYGQAYNVGVRNGEMLMNSKLMFTHLYVTHDKGSFDGGHYNGVVFEYNFLMVLNARAGFYIGNQDVNFNFGVGAGFY